MGRKRKGSVIGDIGKMWVNTIASPFEALTGQNFVDFKYTSDFGKGASKVVEPLTKGISSAMMAMGTTALNAVAPGAGTALSGIGQGVGKAMNNNVQQPPMQMSNKTRPTSGINSVPYGVQEGMPKTGYRHGGMLKAYNAPTHENGGQMIDQNANPTNNPNKAVGEIEKKETSWNGYVFSDTLGEGKKTFAQMSKEIVNRYKGKRDTLSKKTMEKELSLLIQKNEAARLEKEQMEMQQMQNQFTEEELATLQNPQSPSKEQLDRLFAQQQQQQGQPSQEQMMQMMQQQQMQQQGQPSEKEMMMMQQMQQQGAPQDMGQYRWGGNMDVPMYRYQDGGGLNDIDSKMMGQQQIVTNTALPKDSVPTNVYQQAVKGFFEAVAPQVYNKDCNCYEPQQNQFQQPSYANYPFQNVANMPQEMNMQQATMKQPKTPKMPKQPNVPTINLQNANQEFDSKGGIVYQNGGMLEVPEAPLDEYKKGGWIQKVTKSIKKRGTEGVCTGDKFGGPSCPPGSKRYNLAKTFKAMAKKEDGGFIDSFPDLNLANYREGGTIQKYPNGGMMAPEWMESAQWPYRIKEKDKRDDVIKNFYYGIIDDLQNPQAARQTLKNINQYYGTDRLEGLGEEIGPYFGFDYNDINDKDLDRWTNEYMEQRGFNKKPTSGEYKNGGMIKRADGSYSKRGLWDNIRDNIGSGKKPTKEMLEQEAKIKAQEYRDGGYVVTRSNERKGKTHKVTGPDGTVKFFGDPDLKNNPSEKARDAFYARHKKNLEGNPHFKAYARATWRDGGMIPEYPDGGGLDEIATAFVPNVEFKMNKPIPQSFGYTDENVISFVNKAKEIRDKYKKYTGEQGGYFYGETENPQDNSVKDLEELKTLYSKLPKFAKENWKKTYDEIEFAHLYETSPHGTIAKNIGNTGINEFTPIVPKKTIARQQNQNSPIEMPPNYPIDRTVAPYMPMAGQSRPRKSLWFKTTPLEDEIAYDAYNDTYVVPQYPPPAIPDFNLNDVASVGNLFNAPTTNAPNYTPLNQQFPVGTPAPNPFQQMLGNVVKGAADMVQRNAENYPLPEITRGKGAIQTPQQYTADEINLPIPIPSTLENTPNYISTERITTPYERADAFEQQMIAGIPYAPEYTPETPGPKDKPSPTTPEEEPFKLRPLEYATIGLKGLALGKSVYDALQPADKEQLRLNREAGLVNNMMAGRNVNMAAALNEALYNRNAALASNQARSANVQRALDMQTYSNAERNAIRAKLEEQNMNNQLRMQEAQVRAELGASEAAERVRRQNVQSMNEAARRQFGQKAFQDLSTIGTELNKVQVYKDMYKNMKNMSYNKFKEYVTALNEAGAGKFKLKTPTEQDFNAMQMGNFDFDQILEFMKS